MNGRLAEHFCGVSLPLQVLKSAAGFYIGTLQDGMPFTRESVEYFPTEEIAQAALSDGKWTQKRSL